ncbi:MAG: GNAT family N-acetyltransferase [Chloroflexi bacterium]|nr:GNAT family N-acetyltransferase [Chloroflexota bacterium]
MDVVRATSEDWPAVRALLVDAALPLDGAKEAFSTGVVARDGGRLIGAAAIEPYDGAALLRSVAVALDRRGCGVGTALVAAAEDLAQASGAGQLILLTDTAESWFTRLGFSPVDRATVPADVARSVEFETACSATAVAMGRTLSDVYAASPLEPPAGARLLALR